MPEQKYNITVSQKELWIIIKTLGRSNDPIVEFLIDRIKSEYATQRIELSKLTNKS